MKKYVKVISMSVAFLLTVSAMTGCAAPAKSTSVTPSVTPAATSAAPAKDTVSMLLPPVTTNFHNDLPRYTEAFNKIHENITLDVATAAWNDLSSKLEIQVNAGSPPDIVYIGQANGAIAKYLATGMMLDISKSIPAEILSDYDPGPLEYMKNGDGMYGLPLYMGVHSIGGNKAFLEEAGIDWKKVQESGWTFDEFKEIVKKGIVKDGDKTTRYGLVYACAGTASADFLELLAMNAGMPATFDKELKYAYTAPEFLEVLQFIRSIIDEGIMPKESNSIDAAKRWNMMVKGETMITGKGLPTFENLAKANNKKLEAKDTSAIEGSILLDYVQLPAPRHKDFPEVTGGGVDGYLTFRQAKEPTQEHIQNVIAAAYFFSSGEVAAENNSALCLSQITKSGREAVKNYPVDIEQYNQAMVDRLTKIVFEPRPDITPELGEKAARIREEVLVPKFQALLANEMTPEEMHAEITKAAIAAFGENGIRK